MLLRRVLPVLLFALVLAPGALAAGGNYAFDGGTRAEREQVKAALDASSFDFGVVPGPVTIHIRSGVDSYATPGQIWLDAGLLDSGVFSWGVVQHEYGHQVDFALLTSDDRSRLHQLLGGAGWFGGAPHCQLDSERFADLISWAYWASPANVMKPAGGSDEGGQASPAAFRAALTQLLPQAAPVAVRLTAAVRPPRKR